MSGSVDVLALFRGRAQDEEPRVHHTCDMGVGCEEYGVCYAAAHGEPERCGRPTVARKPTSDERQGHVDFLSASNGITTAIDHFLAGVDFAHAAVAELIEATSPLASLTVLSADGTIRDDELVLISGERINAIRAALARCRGEA